MTKLRILTAGGKGGTGKTSTSALAICLLDSYGRSPFVVEVERARADNGAVPLRKLSMLMKSQRRQVDQAVALPEGLDTRRNPQATLTAFDPVLNAIEGTTDRDVVIDLGAGITEELLRIAAYADHGEITEGGEGVILLACVKVDDGSSIDDAMNCIRDFRAVYPKGRAVAVLTFVQGSNSTRARREMAELADEVVEVEYETSPYMSVLYGQGFMWPAKLAGLVVDEEKIPASSAAQVITEALGEQTSLAMVNIARKHYLEWFRRAMSAMEIAILGREAAEHPSGAVGTPATAPVKAKAVAGGSRA